MPEAQNDVVVVGAGIGGAVLALSLAQRGWKVKVLERELEPIRIVRPEILWNPTTDALDRLGVGAVLRDQVSVRVAGIEMTRDGRRLIALPRDLLDRAGVAPYSTDPALSRAAIVEAALATGNVSIVRGSEARELVFDGDRVIGVRGLRQGVPFEEHAKLIVGDDGGHSIVRTSLGIPLTTELFPVDFVTAGIQWPDELPWDRVRLEMNPAAFHSGIPAIGVVPWPGRRGAILIPLPHERVERMFQASADDFWCQLAKLTPLAARLSEQLRFPEGFKRVRRPFGHASRYVADGAAIIGDAAHPMSPAGGQGANASIWDALTLAEVAHEGLTLGDLGRQRLSRYEALRRPPNARSVRISTRAARTFRTLSHVPGLRWLVPSLLRTVDHLPPLKRRLVSAASTTFVTRTAETGRLG